MMEMKDNVSKGGGAYLVTGAGALFFDEMEEVDGATNFFSFLSISERRLYTILYT